MLLRFILVSLFFITSFGGTAGILDSLKTELTKINITNNNRCFLYGDLAWEYSHINVDSSFKYANLELELAKKLNDIKHECDALNTLGMLARLKGDIRTALSYYQQCLRQYYKVKDTNSIAALYNNIGIIYQGQKNYKLALKYISRGLNFYEKSKDKLGISNSFANLGICYNDSRDYVNAEKYFLKSVAALQHTKNSRSMAHTYVNLGGLYWDCGKFEKAEYAFKSAMVESKKAEDEYSYYVAMGNYGQVQFKKGHISGAEQNCKESYDFGKKNQLVDILQTGCDCLYLINKSKGIHQAALKYFEELSAIKDSVRSKEVAGDLAKKEAEFEYSLKYTQDSLKNAQEKLIRDSEVAREKANNLKNEAELAKKQIIQYTLFGGLFIVMIFALFIFNRFKITQRQKRIIEEKEKETQIQKQIIEEKQKEIIDSIHYAKRIQQALLPNEKLISKIINKIGK